MMCTDPLRQAVEAHDPRGFRFDPSWSPETGAAVADWTIAAAATVGAGATLTDAGTLTSLGRIDTTATVAAHGSLDNIGTVIGRMGASMAGISEAGGLGVLVLSGGVLGNGGTITGGRGGDGPGPTDTGGAGVVLQADAIASSSGLIVGGQGGYATRDTFYQYGIGGSGGTGLML